MLCSEIEHCPFVFLKPSKKVRVQQSRLRSEEICGVLNADCAMLLPMRLLAWFSLDVQQTNFSRYRTVSRLRGEGDVFYICLPTTYIQLHKRNRCCLST